MQLIASQLGKKIINFSGVKGVVELKFANEAEMFWLNRKYRQKAKTTDVLSFPSTLDAGEARSLNSREPLGLIVLSLNTIQRRFHSKFQWMLKEKVKSVLVHGFAHLLHYDHHTTEEYRQMHKYEQKLLQKFKNL